jgi:glutathione S-transferase
MRPHPTNVRGVADAHSLRGATTRPGSTASRGGRQAGAPLVLVSHVLCPYVQRAAIVLAEKAVAFERRDVDLADKPDWFLRISPLGKTPVLLLGDEAIFESAVICEYLEETALPRLHPADALQRAKHRAWMEFGSALLNAIAAFYNAPDDTSLRARAAEIRARLAQVELALGEGPYFAGEPFSIVDAVFGPAFRYFDTFDRIADFGFWAGLPKVRRWRRALAVRPSVVEAVRRDYPAWLHEFLLARGSALSRRMSREITAA